jgi:chromosome segregation ATPase
LSGPILCSILQTYANRLQKKSPAVIQSAFNRAVAAEARKNIEKLYVDYLESMGKIESKIPCSEEELWTNHAELSANLLERFDSQMQDYSECEEILSEKNTVLHRMKSYYEELKDSNSRISEEKSKKLFKNLFEATKNDEDFIENITENEEKLITSIKQYYDKAQGPSAYKVFLEEIMSIVAFLCDNLRDSVQQNETNFEDLTQEIENLKKNREKSRQNEERLKELLEETIKNYEKQLENKEKIISELQSSFSTKANIFETKVKNLTREIKSLQQELDHEQKEKEALLDVEKEIFNNKRLEFEETISKLKEENSRLERENEEILTTHEQSLSAKASEIIELKNREKFSEAPTESLENYSILNGLKQDLAEIFTKFNNEQTTNIKLVAQMDKIASLQSELNKFRLKEIENRNKLIDDYEEKISNLKDNNEELLRACSEFKRTKSLIPRNTEIEDLGDKVSSLENNLNRKTEQIDLLNDTIQKRDDQIQALYKVIEVHKKQFEELETSVDDKDNELHKVKIELVQLRDDSDTLIGLMGYALEVLHKKRNIQAISLTQIQNMNNRARVAKIFKKFGIPFE